MVALDGGVVETTPELPMERRLERIHRSLAELIAWHEPKAMAIEDGLLRQERALGDGRRPGQRRGDAGRRRSAGSAASPTRRRRSRWRSAAPAAPARNRCSGWSAPCSGCPSRRRPTTPPTRSRWRSATAAAAGHRQAVAAADEVAAVPRGAGGRMIAAVRGEVMVRRPDHVVIDAGRRRLPAGGLRGDAESRAGHRQRGLPPRRADRPRRLARSLRLLLRGGARPLPPADLGQRRRPESRDRRPSPAAAPAICCGRSRPATRNASRRCRGSASGPRSGSSSSCARRSPARSRRRSPSAAVEDGDARAPRPRRPRQPRLRAAGGRAAARRRSRAASRRSWSRRRCARPAPPRSGA